GDRWRRKKGVFPLRRRSLLSAMAGSLATLALPPVQLPALGSTGGPRPLRIVAQQGDNHAPASPYRAPPGRRTPARPHTGAPRRATTEILSPAIDAGQLFDRLGVQLRAAPGAQDSLRVEVRASADGSAWTDWRALISDPHMADAATNTQYVLPVAVPEDSRF